MKNLLYILVVILLLLNIRIFAQESNINSDTLYSANQVDLMPKPSDSLSYLIQEIIMSSGCICPGTAYFSLIIEKDGSVSHAELFRKTKGCWEENILKIFLNSNNWTPGNKNGKLVRTIILYPLKVATPITEPKCE